MESTVLFTDECNIYLNNQIWVQRPEDTAYLNEYMTHQLPSRSKISIWAGHHPHQAEDEKERDRSQLQCNTDRASLLHHAGRFVPKPVKVVGLNQTDDRLDVYDLGAGVYDRLALLIAGDNHQT